MGEGRNNDSATFTTFSLRPFPRPLVFVSLVCSLTFRRDSRFLRTPSARTFKTAPSSLFIYLFASFCLCLCHSLVNLSFIHHTIHPIVIYHHHCHEGTRSIKCLSSRHVKHQFNTDGMQLSSGTLGDGAIEFVSGTLMADLETSLCEESDVITAVIQLTHTAGRGWLSKAVDQKCESAQHKAK